MTARTAAVAVAGATGAALLALIASAPAGASVTAASTPVLRTGAAHASGRTWRVQVLSADPAVQVDGTTVQPTKPDDLGVMGGRVFVAYQNGIGPQGQASPSGATQSTIVEYGHAGRVLGAWAVTGKADGLTTDPAGHRVFVTVNEDANTSLYVLAPHGRHATVTHYRYSPDNPLPHGGGTDSIVVAGGHVYVSASAPGTVTGSGTTPATMPALYSVTLDPRAPGGAVADLTPVLFDGSTATVANIAAPTLDSSSPAPSWSSVPPEGTRATLALTDPDSSEAVPKASPRFAGDLVLDSQGDMQQIYVAHPGTPSQALSVLYLSQSVDNTAYVASGGGALYVDDPSTDAVYRVTGPLTRGEAVVAATPGDANSPGSAPSYLGLLDLRTGTVTPIPALAMIVPQGMIWAP